MMRSNSWSMCYDQPDVHEMKESKLEVQAKIMV